jgi:TPR repeat protein
LALTVKPASWLLVGTLLADLWVASAGAATPEDGRRAYDAGHFADAMGIWAELSRSGSAEAAFGLGLMYDLGNGTEPNPEAAFFWYKKAAEAGLVVAEFNVGALYDSGRGVPRNSEDAAIWYAKAAAHGHHRAQFDLGLLYAQGDGVPRNPDVAAVWLRAAADGGVFAADARLRALEVSAPKRPVGPMTGAALIAPTQNAMVPIRADNPTIELVWVAPPEARTVRYEVQVHELSSSTLPAVFTASVTGTAVLVRLPVQANFYVWDVDAVAQDGSRASSGWSWFSTGSAQPAERSMTATQAGSRGGQ